MNIKSVTIENFRCFKKLYVEFEKTHTLIGENGVGKTTILEAFKIATSPSYLTSLDRQKAREHLRKAIV